MKKILFTIARYSDHRQKIFDNIISPRNKLYCEKHEYKYIEIKNDININKIRDHHTWWKFTILQDLIKSNRVTDGDLIINIDADIYIVDIEKDLSTPKSFSYSIDSGNTHCMGWYSIKINDWSKKLIDNILSEERYYKLNDKITIHERLKTYSSFWKQFREQASWYSLAGIKRHSDKSFWDYPNNGFHSEMNEDVLYSLEELNNNVHIFPTEYNVTEWIGESSCDFNINKIDKKDCLLRHFAGGQDWNNYKNWL